MCMDVLYVGMIISVSSGIRNGPHVRLMPSTTTKATTMTTTRLCAHSVTTASLHYYAVYVRRHIFEPTHTRTYTQTQTHRHRDWMNSCARRQRQIGEGISCGTMAATEPTDAVELINDFIVLLLPLCIWALRLRALRMDRFGAAAYTLYHTIGVRTMQELCFILLSMREMCTEHMDGCGEWCARALLHVTMHAGLSAYRRLIASTDDRVVSLVTD